MRFGAIDLLAPPAGRNYIYFATYYLHTFYTICFRIGILGFLTYKRAMSELSFQEVYITDPLHVYIHTVCVYSRVFFAIFIDFLDFLWILWIFWVFYWIFLIFPFCFYSAFP